MSFEPVENVIERMIPGIQHHSKEAVSSLKSDPSEGISVEEQNFFESCLPPNAYNRGCFHCLMESVLP